MELDRVPPHRIAGKAVRSRWAALPVGALWLLTAAACGGDDGTVMRPSAPSTITNPTSLAGSGATIPSTAPTTSGTPASGNASGSPVITPSQPVVPPNTIPTTPPPAIMPPPTQPMMPVMQVTAPMQTPFTGPLDGDPAKPMVDVPGLKCGPLAGGFGATPQTVKITNRDVVVGYPCAHEGAAVTFFLFLHGTLQEEQKVPFTMNAFAIHKLIDSHNVIMALPKAVGTQWGNGDMGADLPHLYEVIDWVYATFGTKFNIRSMWSQGGSWGAAYLARFACDEKLKDRLRGIQLIVGGGCPACSDRLSCIVGQQELQLGNGMALAPDAREKAADMSNIAPYAAKHGCGMKMGPTDVGNVKYWVWPNCSPGWVHSYYMAPGQHADAWDAAAVLKMTEEMKSTEK